MTRHVHADVIHAYAEGAKVQYKDNCGGWVEGDCWSFLPEGEYRIKPVVVSYRRYLAKNWNGYWVGCLTKNHERVATNIETHGWFVRWIDEDWQEEGI